MSKTPEPLPASHSLAAWIESPATALPPVAFMLDGRPAHEVLPAWKVTHASEDFEQGTRLRIAYADPKTGLIFEIALTTYRDNGTQDWIASFENRGKEASALIENWLALDAALIPPGQDSSLYVRWSVGDDTTSEAFMPHERTLSARHPQVYSSEYGRSSSAVLPIFALRGPSQGWYISLGWAGQWKTEFRREEGGAARVRAGMEDTRFRLEPGERVRGPRMLLLPWGDSCSKGDSNCFRKHLLAHVLPKAGLAAEAAPLPVCSYYDGEIQGAAETQHDLQRVHAAAELGCEAVLLGEFWMGESIGEGPAADLDKKRYPKGILPIANTVRAHQMRFGMTFEIERVAADSQFAKDHPDFLLTAENRRNALIDFGNPKAWQWLVEKMDARVKQWQIDILRHDVKAGPLVWWRANDAEDRKGVTEMRYVDGMYRFWDELRKRNPGLLIDANADGGRRIGVETLERTVVLCRASKTDADPGDAPDRNEHDRLARASQVQIGGLSQYLPAHAGPIWGEDPYAVRSGISEGALLYGDLLRPGLPTRQIKLAIAELRSVRHLWRGDYYPLAQLLLNQRAWWAFQLHRPDLGEGVVFMFRRPDSPYPVCEVDIQAIDPEAKYIVSFTDESFTEEPKLKMTGKQFCHQDLRINLRSGSKLVRYRRLPDPTARA